MVTCGRGTYLVTVIKLPIACLYKCVFVLYTVEKQRCHVIKIMVDK